MLARTLVTLIAFTLLGGCSVLRPADSAGEVTGREWQFDGKLGVWYRDSQESANIRWINCAGHYRIRLSGPMGSSSAMIEGDEKSVTLKRSGEEPISAPTPDRLAAELGWPLPVSALRHWVRGQPVPLEPFGGQTDDAGHLEELRQQGWSLRFDRYTSPSLSAPPSLVEVYNDTLRAKLIIRQWQDEPQHCAPSEQ